MNLGGKKEHSILVQIMHTMFPTPKQRITITDAWEPKHSHRILFDNKWRNNVSITLTYGKDQRKKNPDDQVRQIASKGEDIRIALNANGTVFMNKGWLKNIKYVLSGSYNNKNSHYEEYYTSATAPYSMTTVDGAIITNKPGLRLYDVEGNEITNLSG